MKYEIDVADCIYKCRYVSIIHGEIYFDEYK